MSDTPAHLKYRASHEWVRSEGDGSVTVGITDYAQSELGDVVFVELPEVGTQYRAGEQVAVVESVKSASDIYAPISGEVIAVNPALASAPETVNESPYEHGWFFKLQPLDESEMDALLDADAYEAGIGG